MDGEGGNEQREDGGDAVLPVLAFEASGNAIALALGSHLRVFDHKCAPRPAEYCVCTYFGALHIAQYKHSAAVSWSHHMTFEHSCSSSAAACGHTSCSAHAASEFAD